MENERNLMSENLKVTIKILGQEVKVEFPIPINQLYADIVQPAAKETGKIIARIPKAINAAFAPVDKWILQREYSLQETKKILEYKLQTVRPEKIVPLEPYIGIPVSLAISYCMDNEELRELFATLLANAMDEDFKDRIHPSFVEIIKQLSQLDVLMIKKGQYLQKYQTLLRVFECKEIIDNDTAMYEAGMEGFCTSDLKDPVFSHYSSLVSGVSQDAKARSISIFNLHRLGLINTDYIEKIIPPGNYKSVYNELMESDFYKQRLEMAVCNNLNLRFTRGYTSPTEFGRQFYELCCV